MDSIDKSLLRKEMIKKRKAIDPLDRGLWDRIIFNRLISRAEYEKSNIVFIYVSYNGEADTHKIIEHLLLSGKTVCVPRVISKAEGMEAVAIESIDDLISGAYGILEPRKDLKSISPERIDLAIIPGVAFDSNGGRLGYGGGFYDRFLRNMRADSYKIALSYGVQVVNNIPMDPLDERISTLITNI